MEFELTAIVMDIVGAETDVLLSADLMGVRVMIVEVHPHISGDDAVAALLTELDRMKFEKTEQMDDVIIFRRQDASLDGST